MAYNSNVNNNSQETSFDVKYYISKVLGYWKLFLVTIIIALIIARFMSGYKEKRYSLSTLITVDEETNSLFNSGTYLTFNWGGASDLIETTKITLNSRTHNERVVNKLQFYIDYFIEGKYRLEDAYGRTPFSIKIDTSSYQLYNKIMTVKTLPNNKVNISFDISENGIEQLVRYDDNTYENYQFNETEFNQDFYLDSNIETPFFNFYISSVGIVKPNQTFQVKFGSFYGAVERYKNIRVTNISSGSSVMKLQMEGSNKNRIVDYLNTSVEVLGRDKLAQKTLYAQKTKDYIDTLFYREEVRLRDIQQGLGDFKRRTNSFDLSKEGEEIFTETKSLSNNIRDLSTGLDYLDNLEKYIKSDSDYDENIPVPTLVKVEDTKIESTISELISQSAKKKVLSLSVTPNHPDYKKAVNQINITKSILYENITTLRNSFVKERASFQKRLNSYNEKFRKLPEKEQELISYERDFSYSEANYSYLKQKSYEAGTAIEASVSDVKVIDSAMDLGEDPIYPKPSFNYIVGIMLGIIFPLFYIIIKELLDNKIHTVEDIDKKYKIPVLGVIGRSIGVNNLVVFERPKSSVAESFRVLRSNIQFLFKGESENKSKTVVLTSSISGEGKTMISINMATVFALSGKKTILVGLDLRKPKIYNDFELKNDVGIVNYLISQKSLAEVIIKTKIPNLDLILSGPIPPNPSELLLSDACDRMMKDLKEQYDYIVIDTPPVGLVSDALEIFKFSDAICYVIRQNYTKKGMMRMIDDKYVNKEVTNISYILNDFSLKSNYGYGYGYNYGYRYGYGYGYGKYGNDYYDKEESPTTLLGRIYSLIKPKR